jgi:methionyl-tRNA synthetase
MSKSLGNFIDLEKLKAYAARYGLDALRWYLATQGPLAGNDADFSHAKFVEVYNADLANGIGNSTSRVSNMIEKYFAGRLPDGADSSKLEEWWLECSDVKEPVQNALIWTPEYMSDFMLDYALRWGADIVRAVDGFINVAEPFKLAKKLQEDPANEGRLAATLYHCAESLRLASLFFYPAMPEKMAELWRRWNCNHLRDPNDPNSGFVAPLAEFAQWGGPHSLKPGTPIRKGDPLFMRADPAEPPP